MAQKTMTILEDDIDGGEATGTVSFSLDGTSYEIDLNDTNASSLRDAFATWVGHARKTTSRGPAPKKTAAPAKKAAAGANDTAAIREWAKANGHPVSDRGRISAEVKDAYYKATA